MLPKASVIILTYAHPENISCIQDALAGEDVEIIVAQDGLGIRDFGPGVKVYDHAREQPWQCSKARNGGARLATSPALLFLDDDHIPQPGWVGKHLETLQEHDISVGAYDPEEIANMGEVSGSRRDLVEAGVEEMWQVCYSGNLGVRRDTWAAVGGFDERFGGHYGHEDTDFGKMCYLAGKRIAFSAASVSHCGAPVSAKTDAQIAPNRSRFVDKWAQSTRILMIFPGHEFSTYEVARGYAAALRHAGQIVEIFEYHSIFRFFMEAIKANHGVENQQMALQIASQQVAVAMLDFVPDIVVNICGMALLSQAWEYIWRLGVPLVTILTESPYLDVQQMGFLDKGHSLGALVNDKASLARMRGICLAEYLPHSYDPNYHYPRKYLPEVAEPSDVIFVGSMYDERKAFFQAINWADIDLRLVGSAVHFMAEGAARVTGGIPNEQTIEWYRAAKIGLSLNRRSEGVHLTDRGWQLSQIPDGWAYSLGPRTYEQAACGLFQLSDAERPELVDVFADTIPTFRSPAEAEALVRQYLRDENARGALAEAQRGRVRRCTFDDRVEQILLPFLREVKTYGTDWFGKKRPDLH